VCYSVLQYVAMCVQRESFPHKRGTSVLQHFIVLQCVAACCSVLQRVAVCAKKRVFPALKRGGSMLWCIAVCCSVLQRVAVYCSVLQITCIT